MEECVRSICSSLRVVGKGRRTESSSRRMQGMLCKLSDKSHYSSNKLNAGSGPLHDSLCLLREEERNEIIANKSRKSSIRKSGKLKFSFFGECSIESSNFYISLIISLISLLWICDFLNFFNLLGLCLIRYLVILWNFNFLNLLGCLFSGPSTQNHT